MRPASADGAGDDLLQTVVFGRLVQHTIESSHVAMICCPQHDGVRRMLITSSLTSRHQTRHERAFGMFIRALRSWIIQHPITSFLILAYAPTAALAFAPKALTEPGLLPGGATPHAFLENAVGSALPAFIVTALVSGKAGVRDLARRSFKWRVSL